ncbi:MAG: hypothetical protein IPN17_09845 [Deltaproteobacteria bacterium]|jgi:hypothetical protein|nr:hypothetical protein [Deltaproteobacteria bacterium]MBK8692578.1 hypothetical protein [Deltaproteobacteria bacterium]
MWSILACVITGTAVNLLSPPVSQRPEAHAEARPEAGEFRVGTLTVRGRLVPLPPGYVQGDQCLTEQPDWVFPGYTREQVARELDAAAPDSALRAMLDARVTCDARGCVIRPTFDIVLEMSPHTRGTLYDSLARFPENQALATPLARNIADPHWADDEGLSPEIRALLRRLSWQSGNAVLFNDTALVCSQLHTEAEQQAFVASLKHRVAIDATLSVAAGEDVAALTRHWSFGHDAPGVRALLEPLAASPQGGPIDVARLMPPFVRARINTFPPIGAPEYDCFWSSLHFFTEGEPDTRLLSDQEFNVEILRSYVPVPPGETRFGDVLVFYGPGDVPIHAVNVIAPGVVFTKNGNSFRRPWHFARTETIRERYMATQVIRPWRLRRLANTDGAN